MRFLIDAQLPPVLGHLFVAAGHSYKHVAQVALIRSDDLGVWRYATTQSSVIVSKDEDFPKLKALDPSGPQVVWLRVGNCSNRALVRWFQPLLPDVIDRLSTGEGIIEVI